jgi:hypothetical protein
MKRAHSFAWLINEASYYPTKDPLKLLAAAVILRWLEDGANDEIGEEWAEHAEVPPRWLVEAAAA